MAKIAREYNPGELVVYLWVPGEPIAQPRRWQVTNKKTGEAHSIEAPARHKVLPWKDSLRHHAAAAMAGRPPVDVPLRLNVQLLMPRPEKLRKPSLMDQVIPHTKRPDADNCLKAIQDALTHIVWTDDDRISTVFVRKRYVRCTEAPGVLIQVFHDRIPWCSPPQ